MTIKNQHIIQVGAGEDATYVALNGKALMSDIDRADRFARREAAQAEIDASFFGDRPVEIITI